MNNYVYKTHGTCSKEINIGIEGNIIKKISFVGGCSGNTQGISNLCVGRTIDEVIDRLKGIKCGNKLTSCPDQLANALIEIKNNNNK